MESVEQNRLPAATRKEVLDLAVGHPQPHIRELFERFVPSDQRPQRLGNVVNPTQILSLAGDVSRGARLFAATEGIQCKSCHQINKVGTAIGPDLSHVGKQLTRSQILQSILTPSEEINPKFVTYLAETSQGRVVTGLLVEQTKQRIVLRDARNQRIELQASELELLVPQPKSLMPDLLFKDLNATQLADLIAYLESLK